jgi:membrane fusion protein (multidrug efflux system)
LIFRAGAVLLLALALAGAGAISPAAAAAPLPSVTVAPVATANIAPSFSNIGHVVAIQSVKVVPRVTAFIDAVNVQQGSTVKTGEVLFSLQSAQYQAALQTAQASLASAQAALENAQLQYERAARLNATGFEATANLDTAMATRDEDQANVLSAEASVATAQLNLGYCTITSPIDGRIGAVNLTKGNLVTTTADSPILAAAQSDPSESQFAVSLQLPDGKPYPQKGKIAFLDNQVDSSTGTVNVFADFANPNAALLPGAYVNVETAPVVPENVLMVPVAAVQTDQNSEFVLILGPNNTVVQRTVALGQQIGQNFIVKSGLNAGDQVIVDGIQKVKTGQQVNPSPAQDVPAAAGASASD